MTVNSGLPPLLTVGIPLLVYVAAVVLYPRLDLAGAMPDVEPNKLAALTIGVIFTLLGALLAFGLVWFGTDPSTTLLAIGFGLLGTTLAARYPTTATTPKLLVGTNGGLIAYAVSNVLIVTTSATTPIENATVATLIVLLAAIPAILPLPLGHAASTNDPLQPAILAATLISPSLLVVLTVATGPPATTSLYPLLLGGYLLVLSVIGAVLYWTGAELGRTGGPRV